MADVTKTGDRSAYFPAIEKKYGQPMSYWFAALQQLGDAKYPEQISLLREQHGFTQTHANAVVMHHRGSTTSRRYATPDDYLTQLEPVARATVTSIFAEIQAEFPELELVIAWNQPILRTGSQYVIGVSVQTKHITVNPFSEDALAATMDQLGGYTVKKRTFAVPLDWAIDAPLLHHLVAVRLAELGA